MKLKIKREENSKMVARGRKQKASSYSEILERRWRHTL
jgi:hypothetical protein